MEQKVCPPRRENAGLAYDFDPRQLSHTEAEEFFCGERAINMVCPESRYKAGEEYTHFPDKRTAELSEAINCGGTIPRSAWTRAFGSDGAVSLLNETVLHDYYGLLGKPELGISCIDNDLLVAIFIGAGRVVPSTGPFVPLGYQFGFWSDDDASGPYFQQDWLGDTRDGAFAGIFPGFVQDFVDAIRVYDQVSFAVLSAGDGINTVIFDLTGVDRDVEPVLQECGY